MSVLYTIKEISEVEYSKVEVLVLGSGLDDRTLTVAENLSKTANHISTILLLSYGEYDSTKLQKLFPDISITIFYISEDSTKFLYDLQGCDIFSTPKNIMLDITSIRIPEMFLFMKYLRIKNIQNTIEVTYTTPLEYEFAEEPFTSYHSYYGNLRTDDLLGFSGTSEDMAHSQMIIFLGFEGVLSAKVNEDVKYSKLVLVNNLPSFFEKYKDISVINNFELLSNRHDDMNYVPANNPFETYNFLNEKLDENELACIAPLSTKPVALGVCLYALSHESLRVVYPTADEYNFHRTNSVHETYIYTIPLNK